MVVSDARLEYTACILRSDIDISTGIPKIMLLKQKVKLHSQTTVNTRGMQFELIKFQI
jgi:hypothetical protein